MPFLKPDKIRTERIGKETLTIKEKIIPDSAVACKDLYPKNCPTYAKKGQPMKPRRKLNDGSGIPRGITVHNTDDIKVSSKTTPAEQYTRATWPNCNMRGVVVHYYVWHNDIWQNLKENERGYHAADGSSRRAAKRKGQTIGGNMDTIAIESIGPSNQSTRTTQILCAYLCNKYKLDPNLDIYQHNDFYKQKNCPMYIRPQWDSFIKGVVDILKTNTPSVQPTTQSSSNEEKYTVHTSLDGYNTADEADNEYVVRKKTTVKPGTYYIYKEHAGMLNLSTSSSSPGSWINPKHNKKPETSSTSFKQTYQVVNKIGGYITASDAKNLKNRKTYVLPGLYNIYRESGGMINVSKTSGSPGSWINPNENIISPTTVVLKVGDSVKIHNDRKTYDGKSLISSAYNWIYKIKEIKKDRVVITRFGIVIAAMKIGDLYKV